MQETHSFEYAIIRVVPRVEREEFFNAGVILYCRTHKFLNTIINVDEAKLKSLCMKTDADGLKEHLQAFVDICNGTSKTSPIAKLDIASRFRWLTAARSTIVQSSKVHPGICSDPDDMLKKLYRQYVL